MGKNSNASYTWVAGMGNTAVSGFTAAIIATTMLFSASLLPQGSTFAQNRAFVQIEQQRDLPVRGQTRSSVRSQYGEPQNISPAVGQPPISKWSYAGFTVYFEYSHVITTVAEEDALPVQLGGIQ